MNTYIRIGIIIYRHNCTQAYEFIDILHIDIRTHRCIELHKHRDT